MKYKKTLAVTFHVGRRIRCCVVVMESNIDVECEGDGWDSVKPSDVEVTTVPSLLATSENLFSY